MLHSCKVFSRYNKELKRLDDVTKTCNKFNVKCDIYDPSLLAVWRQFFG